MTLSSTQYDLVIVGGGLAGLCLNRQILLERPATKILILEKSEHPVPALAHKVGEATVELGAWYFAQKLQLEAHLKEQHLPKFGLRFYFSNSGQTLDEGMELGLTEPYDTPSYQLDRGLLENHLTELAQADGATHFAEARVKNIDLNEDGGTHEVTYLHHGQTHRVTTRWVVDASGRSGFLRRKLDLNESIPHQVNSAWFRLNHPLRVDDWQPLPITRKEGRIQRWLSVNHLMGEGYWIWLISLPGGATSFGVVADPRFHALSNLQNFDRLLEWLAEHEPSCFKAIDPHRDKLMDFKLLRNFSHGCKQLFSEQRWAVTGEAGPFLDPFYSPGSDFIAINNTFLTALILRDLRKRPITAQAQIYNLLFKQIFGNTLRIYQDQYQLFGNPRVMPLKVTWDYAVYWSFTAFLGMQDVLADLTLYERIRQTADTIGKLNAKMQAFFRQWHREGSPQAQAIFVDQCALPLLRQLNNQLTVPVPREDIPERMGTHLQDLRNLSAEIVRAGMADAEGLSSFLPEGSEETSHLRDVLNAILTSEVST